MITGEVSLGLFEAIYSLRCCSISKQTDGLFRSDPFVLHGARPYFTVKVSRDVQSKEWSDRVMSTISLARKRGTASGFLKMGNSRVGAVDKNV